MLSFRVTRSSQIASVMLIALLALAGCNNGGGGNSLSIVQPAGLSYPIPAPLIQGVAISPLTPSLAAGGTVTYTVTPALPAGLSLDPVTGAIRGIPLAVTPLATYIIRASNILGGEDFPLELVVNPPAPCGLTYVDIGATYLVGQAISPNTATLSCGPADLFTVTPSLPAGLVLDALTGEVSGTPTVAALLAVYTVIASNVTGGDSFDLTITVNPEAPCGLAFSDPAPIYTVNTQIATNVGSSACGPPSNWSVTPSLPAGLLLDAATGTITGTPLAELAATLFTFTGSNVTGLATVDMTLAVNPEAPLTLSYSEQTATYLADLAIATNVPALTGGTPDSWSVAPTLPTGLLLDPTTGEITGTPTAITPTANYLVTASNISGSAQATLTLTVDPQAPCNVAYPLTNAVYQQDLPILANTPSFSCGTPDLWTISPPLPAGLALDPTTGEISGAPSVLSALTSYTVTATNTTGSDTVGITISVNPQAPCNLTYGNLSATYLDGVTITPNAPSSLCGPVTMYSITPTLPAGLSISSTTGVISGAPAGASPTTSYTVVAANVSGSDSVALSITVIPQAPCTLTYSDSSAVYQLDLPITANVPTVGCGTPNLFEVTPALPTGLALSPTTGQIVGTPTALVAQTSHVITASNASGSISTTITIEVVPQPPCNVSYADLNPVYVDQTAITANIASFDCGTPDSWSIAPPLPAGFNFNTQTGAITGTPAGLLLPTAFTVTAMNATGSDSVVVTITVNPLAPCNLTYTDLTPTYLVGLAITANQPTVSCGAPTAYSVVPALPSGLALNSVTGVITGTPSARFGTGSYTVKAENVTGSAVVVLTITVNPQAPCNLTYLDPTPVYVVGTPIALNTTIFGCGAPDSYTISPSLPAGLNFDPLSGTIRGIPTSVQPSTVHTVIGTNVTGFDTTTISITVNPEAPCNLAYSAPVATYTVNDAIATNFPSFACGAPDTFVVNPALPNGLLLNPNTGTISGTPTIEAATVDYTVTASNATGSDSAVVTITVNPEAPCNLVYSGTNEIYLVGVPIATNAPTFDCGTPTAYAVTPALPNGLLLNGVTGEITGTPLVVNLFTIYTITGSNVSGSDTATISLTVNPQAPCNLSYSSPDSLYTVGTPIALNVPDVDCGAPSSYLISPPLPSGLTLNPLTGVISGTPGIQTPQLDYTITAANISGSDTVTIQIEIQPQTPCNLHYTLETPIYRVGTTIPSNVPSFDCGTPTSFSVVPQLPAGLNLNIFTGIITGLPVLPAPSADYVVTASNASGGTDVTLTITVDPLAPCTINYATPAASYLDGTLITPNVPSFTCGAPDLWSIAPSLPAGLGLNTSTGVISGTPLGVSPLTTYLVTGQNVTGSDSVQISIQVLPQAPCNLSYTTLAADYQLGLPITANLPSHSCGLPNLYEVSPALPVGLNLDPTSGVITGTPAAITPSATYTVTASNASGSDTVDLVLAVIPQAPCNVDYPVTTAVYLLGDTITPNVPTFGCGTPDSWTINPPLPAGLLFSGSTGTISGAPTALSAATSYSVTASNATGSDIAFISITVNPQAPAGLTYADPAPTYLRGTQITSNAPSSTGGPIASYAIDSALPTGLSFDTITGVIFGTPTVLFPATPYTITATNVTGSTDATVTITVNPQAPTGLAYDVSNPVYLVGDLITPNAPTSTGGPVDSYSVTPTLPAGLLLNPTTGVITGTPTTVTAADLYTVTATNVSGTDTAILTITVNPQGLGVLTYSAPSPTYLLGDLITPNVPTFTGGTPDSYTVLPLLPSGLTLDGTTGVITGAPLALQSATIHTITAMNVTGSASAAVTITVNPQAPTGLSYDDLTPTYVVGATIVANQASVTGDVDSYSVFPPLPLGLFLNGTTGEITGAPTLVAALATYTVTAENVTGTTTVDLAITVDPAAPAGLSYATPTAIYLLDVAIATNAPTSTGGPIATYSVAPALPLGLVLNATTGEISGMPTALQLIATAHTVTAENVTGSTTADVTITVNPQAPAGLSYGTPTAIYLLGDLITPNSPTSTGGQVELYTVDPVLPLGLSLNATTGQITGTPTLLGTSAHAITATNVTGADMATVTITVNPQAPTGLSYTDPSPTYVDGTQILDNLATVTGTGVTFSVSPTLPTGLLLNTSTGTISGTPSGPAALVTYTVTAENVTGLTTFDLAITVDPAAPAGLAYGDPAPIYLLGTPIATNAPTSTGGAIETYTVLPPLPAGLLLNASSGEITGTPTELVTLVPFTITGENATGSTDAMVTITVNPQAPTAITYPNSTPAYLLGDLIAPNLPIVTGGTPTLFEVSPALPAGLDIDALTGEISGTPSALVTASPHLVTASNATGSVDTTITITVNPQAPTGLSYLVDAPIYVVGTTITPNTATVTGDLISFSVLPTLPLGLALDGSTGAITGTPTEVTPAAGYVVTATNVTGSTTATLLIAVNPAAPAGLSYAFLAPSYLVGDPIADNAPTSTGGPITLYTISPSLQLGLGIDPSTGVISGTPTVVEAATLYTITGSNVTGSTTASVTITVNPQGVGVLTYSEPAPTYLLDLAITPNVPTITGGTPDLFEVSPALPLGLSLHPTSGVISGTPTELQLIPTIHTITATNVTGSTTGAVTITVNPQAPAGLTYSEPSPTYTAGVLIAPNLPTVGGGDVATYSVSPLLPSGLNLNATTGEITGTPDAEVALATYTVTALNVTGEATFDLVILVNPAAPAGLSYSTPIAIYLLGDPIATNTPSSTGGTIASYSILPALPAGLLFSTATGEITGTPTVLQLIATAHTVTAENVTGTTTADVTITVNPQAPAGLVYGTPTAIYLLGDPIATNAPTSTGGAIASYSILPALPTGLLFSTATGEITGTPTALQTETIHTVTATNATGVTTADVTITVNPQAPAGLAYGTPTAIYLLGDPIATNAPTSTGGAIASYSILPGLPTGLLFSTATGEITGAPTALHPETIHTVTATNATGIDTATVTITVNPQAPAGLAYGTPTAIYLLGDPIATNAPTSTGGAIASYSILPALPTGLLFSTATGEITGTPTALQAATNHTVTATNATGIDTTTVSVTVNPQAPSGLGYTILAPTYVVGTTIATNSPTVGGGAVEDYSVTPLLPLGLSLNLTTGEITGTPTVETAVNLYTVTASNVTGSSSVGLSILVNPEAPASIGYPFPSSIYTMNQLVTPNVPTFIGGMPTDWSVAPTLPAGLDFSLTTGAITGTPTAIATPGIYVVNASNVSGSTSTIITIGVENPAPCNIVYPATSYALSTGVALAPQTPTVGCGGADSFSIAPALPGGLTLSLVDGTLAGTPTASSPTTVYTVTATNAFGTDTVDLTIAVGLTPPANLDYGQTTFAFVQGQTLTPITPTFTGGLPASWTVAPALPTGLLLNGTTGELSGTPTAITAAATYTVTATNPAGSANVALSIEIETAAPCNLSYSDMLPVYPPGAPITPNVLTVGCGTPDTFAVSPPLPDGLFLHPLTGAIIGVPTTRTPIATYTITATNAFGSASIDLDMRINIVFTYAAVDQTAECGTPFALPLTLLENPNNAGFPNPTVGASIALAYDVGFFTGVTVTPGAALDALGGADYFGPAINNIDGQITIGIIYSLLSTTALSAATEQELALCEFVGHTPGTSTMTWANLAGAPPVDNLVVLNGSATGGNLPVFIAPTVTITPNLAPAGPLSYTNEVPSYAVGVTIDPNFAIVTHGTPDSFSVTPTLPLGLVLDSLTGTITGTPTVASPETTYTITATNAFGADSVDVTITVGELPAITYTDPAPIYALFETITPNAPISTGGAINSFSISPTLPTGLVFSTSTGTISGTTFASIPATVFTVTATNDFGSDTATVTITVN